MKIRDASFHQNPNVMNTSQQNSLHKHNWSDQNDDSLHKHRTWWTQNTIKPRTWFIAQAQQTHSSRSSSIKPRTWWRIANPSKQKTKQWNQSHMNQTHVKKNQTHVKKKSILIKWIKPSTGATDQMDLPTADQLMIHLLETQQTHQNRRSKQWNQNHMNQTHVKKKLNLANATDQTQQLIKPSN